MKKEIVEKGNRIGLKINGTEVDDSTPAGAAIVQAVEQSAIEKQNLGRCKNCGTLTDKKTLAIYGGNCENCNYE